MAALKRRGGEPARRDPGTGQAGNPHAGFRRRRGRSEGEANGWNPSEMLYLIIQGEARGQSSMKITFCRRVMLGTLIAHIRKEDGAPQKLWDHLPVSGE